MSFAIYAVNPGTGERILTVSPQAIALESSDRQQKTFKRTFAELFDIRKTGAVPANEAVYKVEARICETANSCGIPVSPDDEASLSSTSITVTLQQ